MKKITKLLTTYLLAGAFMLGMNTSAMAFEDKIAAVNNTMNTIEDTSASDLITEDSFNDGYEIYIDENGQIQYINFQFDDSEVEFVVESADQIVEEDIEEKIEDKSDEVVEEIKATAEEKKKENKKVVEDKKTDEKKETKKTSEKKASYSEKDLRLLASLVYAEAGNQSYQGKLAVANIVLNRVESNSYSHVTTIKEAIYDKKWAVQFAVTVKNKKTGISILQLALDGYDTGTFAGRKNQEAEQKAMNQAIKAAKAALEGENNIGNYLCFNSLGRGTSSIKRKYPDFKIIGNHIFYRTK